VAASFLAVNLVTPKGVVAHTETDSVQAPGELGEFELLPGHVPMLTVLKPGVLTVGASRSGQEAGPGGSVTRGQRARYAVASGYLRVDPAGAVEILVEQAVPAGEVDTDAAKTELKTAEAELAKWGDKAQDGDYQNLVARADWARAQLDAASH
jgi:F-type H+-transporting ATPase subunit epsilon